MGWDNFECAICGDEIPFQWGKYCNCEEECTENNCCNRCYCNCVAYSYQKRCNACQYWDICDECYTPNAICNECKENNRSKGSIKNIEDMRKNKES